MRRLIILLVLLLVPVVARAQVLEGVTAKEILPTVTSRAQSDFAQDAALTHTLFFGLEYQGIKLELNLDDGKATGWLYRYYSPSLDSSAFFIGVRIPLLGTQAIKLPLDTVTQYFPVTIGTTTMTDPWVDSDAALQGSKDGGAGTFLQANPDAIVTLAFTINNPVQNRYIPQGQYWLLRYSAAADTLTCMVHATTGLAFQCLGGNAPTILSIPPTAGRIGTMYTYTVNAFGNPTPKYALSVAPAGMTIDEGSGRIEWTPGAGQEGTHDVTVIASNQSGTDSQSFQIAVQGAATKPSITSTPVTSAVAGKPYMYQIVASGSPRPTFSLIENPAGMLLDPGRGSLLWTPTRPQAGVHQVRVSAGNSAGSDEQSFSIDVSTVPVIAAIPDQRIAPNKEFQYQVSVDARPAPAFALNSGPTGLTIDAGSGLISWTPTDQQIGEHVVLFAATNSAGTHQQSFKIDVDATVSVQGLTRPGSLRLLSQHPQPASSWLVLQVRTDPAQQLRAEVYDALGRMVLQHDAAADASGISSLRLSVASLRNGTYTCRITAGGQQLAHTFVVAR